MKSILSNQSARPVRRFYLRAVIVMWLGFLSGIMFAWSSGDGLQADDMASGQSSASSEAWQAIKSGATVIDVRTPEEFADGHLPGAVNIPHTLIAERIDSLALDKEKPIVLYCRSGRRAGIAQRTLEALGFGHVYNAGAYKDLADKS